VTVCYLDLAGASYEDVWTINPLLYEGETITGYKGITTSWRWRRGSPTTWKL
jgi:hypothetical protein